MGKSLVEFAVVENKGEGLFVVNRVDVEKGRDLALASAPSAKAAAAEFLTKAVALAGEHMKPSEIATVIRAHKISSGG